MRAGAVLAIAVARGGVRGGVIERQVSFAGGELAPTLWGRTDLSRYPVGARRIRNMIVLPHGPVMNRAGTQHVATLTGYNEVRLVAFVYSETDNSILVVVRRTVSSLQIMEFSRAVDADADDARFAFSVESLSGFFQTSGVNDLSLVRFAQIGNFVDFVSQYAGPRRLERSGGDWLAVFALDFDVPAAPTLPEWDDGEPELDTSMGDYNSSEDDGVEVYIAHNFPHIVIPDDERSDNLTEGIAGLVDQTDITRYLKGWMFDSDNSEWVKDSDHPARPWSWVVTYVMQRADGTVYESLPVSMTKAIVLGTVNNSNFPARGPFTIPSRVAVYADMVRILSSGVAPGTVIDGETLLSTRFYRGRDGRFGFIGETTDLFLDDEGATPDFANPPPQGENPFDGDNPSVITYFQGRLLLASTTTYPQRVRGSALDNFLNFDEIPLADDADSYSFDIASDRNEIVRALVPSKPLVALTSGGVYPLVGSGQTNSLITPNSLPMIEPVSRQGTAVLEPAQLPGATLYAPAGGGAPLALMPDFQILQAGLLSSHLFEGYSIVDWAYAARPWSVLWVVRSDGLLLSLTYVKEQEVLAWAWHEVCDDGLVESVAVKPEGTEDGVYLVVNRSGTRHLERMAKRLYPLTPDSTSTRRVPDVRYAICGIDRTVTYNGAQTAEITFSGSDTDVGESLTVVIDGDDGDFDGRVIQVDDPDGGQAWRLLLTHSSGETYTGQLLTREGSDLTGESFTAWWLCATSVSGLSHLEGQEVTVVADGSVITGLTVGGGSVDLEEHTDEGGAAIAHVGRPYDSELVTLDTVQEKGRTKIVKRVVVEVEHTRGGEVGPVDTSLGAALEIEDDLMVDLPGRVVESGYSPSPPARYEAEVIVPGSWNKSGAVAFRQSDPMPVTVLGIAREVEYGGR